MKNRKLNISSLKVSSFITDLNQQNKMTVKGGDEKSVPCTIHCTRGTCNFTCTVPTWGDDTGTIC